jgi:AraC-like DNA-binding protein
MKRLEHTSATQSAELGSTPRTYLARDVRLRRAEALMPKAAAQRWTLDDIASHLGVSGDHLIRIFREHGLPPPMRQLRRLTLGKMLPRLIEGNESLEVLALDAGYADGSSLRRAFRRAFGKPPSALRRGDTQS